MSSVLCSTQAVYWDLRIIGIVKLASYEHLFFFNSGEIFLTAMRRALSEQVFMHNQISCVSVKFKCFWECRITNSFSLYIFMTNRLSFSKSQRLCVNFAAS